ncbi:endonuclease V [Mucilaginibacter antarcticus]|uniref:endonuclease V n=1 Tax=Mucilaginibacter antarcticus TaxID=1855725 RepID=UPI003640AED9
MFKIMLRLVGRFTFQSKHFGTLAPMPLIDNYPDSDFLNAPDKSLRVVYEDLQNKGFDAGGGEILHYKEKPFTGTIVEYVNGSLVCEDEFTDGHIGGAQRSYHQNGQLSEEYFKAYNTSYGLYKRWDEQGNITYQEDRGLQPYSICLALDVCYTNKTTKVAGTGIELPSEEIKFTEIVYVDDIEDYQAGQFYKRELPCLLKLLDKVDKGKLAVIIIDGHVYVDNSREFGLGGKLWEALNKLVPVIGVAKNSFERNSLTVTEVCRGQSKSRYMFLQSVFLTAQL